MLTMKNLSSGGVLKRYPSWMMILPALIAAAELMMSPATQTNIQLTIKLSLRDWELK